MTLAIWLHTHCAICCEQQQRQERMREGVKRVSCKRCGTVYCALSVRNCADLQQTCLGYVMDEPRSVKPLLLSLIHVTQDNMHRSWGATVGDTEKEADPVGGWGGTEGGGMEWWGGGAGGRPRLGRGRTGNVSDSQRARQDTKTLVTELLRESVIFESFTSTPNGSVTRFTPDQTTD